MTQRAREIVAEAARNARAERVRTELARDGLPATATEKRGFGDTRLLVPTGPEVREPQSRRVEILLRRLHRSRRD